MSAYRCCCGRVLRTRAGAVIHVTVPQGDGKPHRIQGTSEMRRPQARTWGRSADPAGVNQLHPTPAGATPPHTDTQDRSHHDPRHLLGLSDDQQAAIAVLRTMPLTQLAIALRDLLLLHEGDESLIVSSGVRCSPSPTPDETPLRRPAPRDAEADERGAGTPPNHPHHTHPERGTGMRFGGDGSSGG